MAAFLSQFPPVLQALFATIFTWAVTALGAAFVFVNKTLSNKLVDLMLGFAAGVMIYVGFVDLFCSSRIVLGFGYGNLFFLMGLVLIYLLDHLIPHIHMDGQVDSQCDRLYRSGIMTTIGIAIRHQEPADIALARKLWGWPLSPQEKRILIASLRRPSLAQLAETLGLTVGTLKGYINEMKKRADVASLHALVARVFGD